MKRPKRHRKKHQPSHDSSSLSSRIRIAWNAAKQQWIVLAGLIIGLIGTFSSIYFGQHSLQVEEREGKLGGQLEVVFFKGAPLNEDRPTYFFFAIPQDSDDKAGFVMPLHFRVKNDSNASDQSVNPIIQYDHAYRRTEIPAAAIPPKANRPKDQLQYALDSDRQYDYVKHSLTFLSPHDSEPFTDAAFATRIPYDLKASWLFNSGIGLDATVKTYSQRDMQREWHIRYRGLRVPDDAGIEQVVKESYAPQLAFEIRREFGFLDYIHKLLFGKEVVLYGATPKFRPIPNSNLFIPAENPEFKALLVTPYSWKLLFL